MHSVSKLKDDLEKIPKKNLSVKSNKSIYNAVSFLEGLLAQPGFLHEIYTGDIGVFDEDFSDEDDDRSYDG